MTENSKPNCQYIGTEGMDIESEIEKNGGVGCSADAEVILRPNTNSMRDMADPVGKVKVCFQHGKWLESDETERQWEQCGEVGR